MYPEREPDTEYACRVSDSEDLVPATKSDTVRARAAAVAGYPAVASVMPELVEWLQDGNWPVAHVLGPFLRSLGGVPELVTCVRDVLEGSDDIWKYWVLHGVVSGWEAESLLLVEPQLSRLALRPTANEAAEEVDDAAKELLARLKHRG